PARASPRLDHRSAMDVALSPDGRWVAAGSHEGAGVKVWDLTGVERPRLLIPDERITSATFDPARRRLVTGSLSDFIVWDLDTWQEVRRVPRYSAGDPRPRAAFSGDGRFLALNVSVGEVGLFEAASGRPLARLRDPDDESVTGLAFSPDGGRLVVL